MRPRLILAGLLLAQLADAISFLVGVQRLGIAPEANGWAYALHELGGVPAVLVVKGLAIVVTLVVLATAAPRYPRLLVLTGATATSIGLLGATLNTLTFALLG
jgi:hypothetical protein